MKKFIAAFAAVLMAFPVFSQVKWENYTFNEALAKAKETKKLVFLDCYTSWCGPCKWMMNNIFPTKEAGDYFNAKFINIKMDMEKGEGPELAKKFMVHGYPTFLVLDENGNEVGKTSGSSRSVQVFLQRIEEISDISQSPEILLDKYKKSGSVADAAAYLTKVDQAQMENKVVEFCNVYYEKLPAWYKHSLRIWPYLEQAISVQNPKILDDILADKYEFDQYIGRETVNLSLYTKMKYALRNHFRGGNSKLTLEQIEKAVEVLHMAQHPEYFDNLLGELALAEARKDSARLQQILKDKFSIFRFVQPEDLNSLLCLVFNLENLPDDFKREFATQYKERFVKIFDRLYTFYPKYIEKPAE